MDKIQLKVVSANAGNFVKFCSLLEKSKAQLDLSNREFVASHCGNIATAITPHDGVYPDCFILYLSEGSDGFGDIRRIRLHKDFLFAPVIVIGENFSQAVAADYIRHGVQSYVTVGELNPEKIVDFLGKASNKVRIWDSLKAQKKKKNDQLAIVSHDLKGPLTIIRSYMDILLNDAQYDLNEGAREKVKRAKYNAQVAYDLVIDILDEFRSKKSWRMQFAKLNLKEILDEVLENLKIRSEEKSVIIVLNVENEQSIYADRRSMLQLFANIIDNAIKFSPDRGRVRIQVRPHQSALVGMNQSRDYMNVVVSDEGEGIPVDQLKTVFDSYQQVRKSDQESGFGLGLSICRRICHFHMGRIWATSRAVKGTSVHVLLPAFGSSDVKVLADSSSPENVGPISPVMYRIAEQRSILVVDDSKDIRDITKKLFVDLGFSVSIAKNGHEALQALESFTPDLIMLDLNMPIMSGEEFLKEAKSDTGFSVPIFIYSILKSEAIFSSTIRQTHGFVQKPINVEEFVTKSKIHLNWKYLEKAGPKRSSEKKPGQAVSRSAIDDECGTIDVLLVDDCRDNHDILQYHFHKSNHRLDSALSAKECLQKLNNRHYDIILMDLVMPVMDGFQAVEKVLETYKSLAQKPPLIYAFSVDDAELSVAELQRQGFDGYLKKPLDLGELNEVLSQFQTIDPRHGRGGDRANEGFSKL